MFRIDDATAATSLPAPEASGTEGYFTEGNPVAGTPATNVRGSWLNMIQEELRALVVYGGLTPSKTVYTQVRDAIVAKFAKLNGDNTQVFSVAPATQSQHAMQLGQATGRLLNIQYITSSGTYTPTVGANTAIVEGVGGGGAGGGTPNPGSGSASAGGGGSAGTWGRRKITSPVATTVTIGAGGTGVVGAGGTSGGTTSFGALLSLPGGGGAPVANSSNVAQGTGTAGSISAGPTSADLGYTGASGTLGIVLSTTSGLSGVGASSPLGSGGLIAATTTSGAAFSGNAGAGFGSGGSGGVALGASSTTAGGNGAKGIIVVWEYA